MKNIKTRRWIGFICFMLLMVLSVSTVTYASDNSDTTETESKKTIMYLGEEITYVQKSVKNRAGKAFELFCDKEVIWPDTDAEILAKFLNYEGGTAEEKELIASIIVARMKSDDFPDSVKGVLTQNHWFYINSDFWNSMEDPTEEEIALAEEVLAGNTDGEYIYYIFKMPEMSDIERNVRLEHEFYETEHYIFYK